MVSIDRAFLKEYLRETLEDDGIELPDDISLEELTNEFIEYLEADIHEWLKDNYKSFFDNVIWERIQDQFSTTTEFIAERRFQCRICHQEIPPGAGAVEITVGRGVFQYEHASC